jgi:hypothetical protein
MNHDSSSFTTLPPSQLFLLHNSSSFTTLPPLQLSSHLILTMYARKRKTDRALTGTLMAHIPGVRSILISTVCDRNRRTFSQHPFRALLISLAVSYKLFASSSILLEMLPASSNCPGMYPGNALSCFLLTQVPKTWRVCKLPTCRMSCPLSCFFLLLTRFARSQDYFWMNVDTANLARELFCVFKSIEKDGKKPPSFARRQEESWNHPYAEMTKGVECIIGSHADSESSKFRTQGIEKQWKSSMGMSSSTSGYLEIWC